jgi:hypothetical protein
VSNAASVTVHSTVVVPTSNVDGFDFVQTISDPAQLSENDGAEKTRSTAAHSPTVLSTVSALVVQSIVGG